MSQREIHLPICIATSLHSHQKQIRCRSKWPREIVSRNSREQSHDLSSSSRAGVGCGAIELTHFYIVENSICPFGSSNCFRFTRHQSNLFVGAHQDVRTGLRTVKPIQFAPSVPRGPSRAEHKTLLLRGRRYPNDKINTHKRGLGFIARRALSCRRRRRLRLAAPYA